MRERERQRERREREKEREREREGWVGRAELGHEKEGGRVFICSEIYLLLSAEARSVLAALGLQPAPSLTITA